MLPHPDKVSKGGEDAYFISEDGLALGNMPYYKFGSLKLPLICLAFNEIYFMLFQHSFN